MIGIDLLKIPLLSISNNLLPWKFKSYLITYIYLQHFFTDYMRNMWIVYISGQSKGVY